ncbi:glycosyltransferase [Pannus brasiliensis CCIBt3594]|uniref:Glycosyltransferase n=1 Tax=Pannus brasiliensis CCIBt3594 TaxID=1427578 RepID=A0AAW9QFZ3_9CHRO
MSESPSIETGADGTKRLPDRPTLGLCICTMNRPEELENCLQSIFRGEELPDGILVSDDSPDGTATRAVVSRYPDAIYREGPRRGLGANRNACIQHASADYLLFLDDDTRVSPDFPRTAREAIASAEPNTVITGYEIKHERESARKVTPHNLDFWGFQRLPVEGEYRSIVINATIFPRSLFGVARFDERLRYGSEEIDMAHHAVSLGYRIVYDDRLHVHHYPSPTNRSEYDRYIHASRLYATAKSYWRYERSIPKTLAYLFLAPPHLLGSALKKGDGKSFRDSWRSIVLASQYLFNYLQT